MSKYSELDRVLNSIRRNKGYDLYKKILESQKIIDSFYRKEISENEMMNRKIKLESYTSSRNILYFPTLITIVFGILINIVSEYNGFKVFNNLFEQLQSIPLDAESIKICELVVLFIMIFILFFAMAAFYVGIFLLMLSILYLLHDSGKIKEQRMEYELKILNDKIDQKIKENKEIKDYECHKKSKYDEVLILLLVIMLGLFAVICMRDVSDIFVFIFIVGLIGYTALIINCR